MSKYIIKLYLNSKHTHILHTYVVQHMLVILDKYMGIKTCTILFL